MKFTIGTGIPSANPTIPNDRRGVIKGKLAPLPPRKGGDITNAAYAKENDISKRQASKQRRGY